MLIPLLAIGGSESFRAALDFTTGVLALVALTASIAWGLIATDRLLLSPRHRLLAQAVHRATAAAALGFLLLHATVKVALGHVGLVGALVPFGLGVSGTSGLIGFGSLAGLLMVITAATGALRSALAGSGTAAGRWRTLHMLAYPAWCFALLHGLFSGRPAAPWVVLMYGLALVSVAGALSIRLLPRPVKREIAGKILAVTNRGSAEAPVQEATPPARPTTAPFPGTDESETEIGLERMNGIPAQRPYGAVPPDRSAVGRRRRQPGIAPPSPRLYEVPPRPAAEPTGAAVTTGNGPAGAGTGIAAAYHAVSRAGEPFVPLAQRVPMTEELPVMTESGPAGGGWPTPSPPPPAPAFPPAPFAPPHPSAPPRPHVPTGYEPNSPGSTGYGSHGYASTGYGSNSGPHRYASTDSGSNGYASTGLGDGFFRPPPADSPFDAFSRRPAPTVPTPPPQGPPPPYEAPVIGTYETVRPGFEGWDYGGAPGTERPDPYGTAEAVPGPFFPPLAGEPWNAPAGERP
ncbi:hypothetical protein ABZ348_07160 [Streptomyces sp. NPDC005963]|uniref:hypothetical protein n=1 Tax=Streptomyces sp. NPDC005963 TaxID=3156721 RepID=UPI0033D53479